MFKQSTTLACTLSAALFGSLAMSGIANADENPFGLTQLDSSYTQLAMEEGKCGGKEKKEAAKCGGMEKKEEHKEGKCGGMEKKEEHKEGKCGGMEKKEEHKGGKCGTAKCGAGKDKH